MPRGGCVLEVGPARVDAQLGPAMERIRAELTTAELVTPEFAATDLAEEAR